MQRQPVEAKVYSSANRLTVVAPMPGLDATQIAVSLAGDLLTIETAAHAARPCGCRVALPRPVDAGAATAVYAYGVLVVAMPRLDPGGPLLDELGPGLVKPARAATGGAGATGAAQTISNAVPTGGEMLPPATGS